MCDFTPDPRIAPDRKRSWDGHRQKEPESEKLLVFCTRMGQHLGLFGCPPRQRVILGRAAGYPFDAHGVKASRGGTLSLSRARGGEVIVMNQSIETRSYRAVSEHQQRNRTRYPKVMS